MVAEPYLVAGRDRVDTALMEVAPGVVVKVGAEGLVCAAVLGAGIGIAVKIADGSARAAGPALIHALRQLEIIEDLEVEKLRVHARPDVLGGGRPVGEMKPDFALGRA